MYEYICIYKLLDDDFKQLSLSYSLYGTGDNSVTNLSPLTHIHTLIYTVFFLLLCVIYSYTSHVSNPYPCPY